MHVNQSLLGLAVFQVASFRLDAINYVQLCSNYKVKVVQQQLFVSKLYVIKLCHYQNGKKLKFYVKITVISRAFKQGRPLIMNHRV